MDCNSDNSDFLSLESSDCDSFHSIDSSTPPLPDSLSSIFQNLSKHFNVIHINAQSVPAHHTDLLTLASKDIHAILISETWFNPSLSSVTYSLPGYNLIRNDRIGMRGGGVAIYLRSHIPFSIINSSPQPPPSNAAEHLLIEVLLSNCKLLLGVFYSPSSSVDYFASFEDTIDQFSPLYKNTIIMGDFNTCLLKNDSRSRRLISLTHSYNLQNLHLNATHKIPGLTPSLLDLIFVSSPHLVAKYGQLPAVAFSHHDLLYLSFNAKPPKQKPTVVMRRCFGGIDHESLLSDAFKFDWSGLYDLAFLDDKVELFTSSIINLYDKHAPVRRVKLKHLPAPWLTDEIKSLIHKKNRAKAKMRTAKSDAEREKYKVVRNRCNTRCRDAQRQHIHDSISNGDTAKIWKFLKNLGIGRVAQNDISSAIDIDNLNSHFTSSTTHDKSSLEKTLNNLASLPTPNFIPFNFTEFTEPEVEGCIRSISSDAVGCDQVSRAMILPILPAVLQVITHIFNYSVKAGKFPTSWKDSLVIPIPKRPDPTNLSDYRPISILPFLSKALERLIHSQLSGFLNKNSILDPFQSGFRPGHSTTTALVKVSDDIRQGMDDGQLTVLTLLDFSNAFNTVNFEILLGLLRSLKISPSAIAWFDSYLNGRRQRIKINETHSQWNNVSTGVPQGGVLSPLLFSIFINSLTARLLVHYHLYADDLQVYVQSTLDRLPLAIQTMNDALKNIANWSKDFGLKINPSKSQVIVIGSPFFISRVKWAQIPDVYLDGVALALNKNVKNLGVFFDQTLSWGHHVKVISRKLYAASNSLRRLSNFLPIRTKTMLAQSLLLPILDYADSCTSDMNEELLNKLERLQNLCIRFIFGLRKYDHVSKFRRQLGWLPIRLRRDAHILQLLYSILFNPKTPSYLKNNFKFLGPSNYTLRSSNRCLLEIPSHSSSFIGNSFRISAIRLWNKLPESIRLASSLSSFKTLLYKYFLTLSYPDQS